MNIDRKKAQQVQADVKAAIEAVLATHGMTLSPTKCSFSSTELRITLLAVVTGEKSRSDKRADMMLADNARYYGLVANEARGNVKLVGFRPNARKMPWIIERDDGRKLVASNSYAFTHFSVDKPSDLQRINRQGSRG